MTRNRSALVGLALVLLVLAGAGLYLYQNLPALLRQQARDYLRQYGVQHVEYTRLQISSTELRINDLSLRGRYGNIMYDAQIPSAQLHYSWRVVLGEKIQSVTLSHLDLAIEQGIDGGEPEPDSLNIEELLPQHLIALMPVQFLEIQHWNLDYRSPNLPDLSASGNLRIDEQLDLQLTTDLFDRNVAVALHAPAGTDAAALELAIALREGQSDIATVSAQLRRTAKKEWTWECQGQLQYAPLLAWLRQPAITQLAALQDPLPETLQLQGESTFTALLLHPNVLHLTVAPGTEKTLLQQLQGELHLVNRIQRFDLPGSIEDLHGELTVDGIVAGGEVKATVQPFALSGDLASQSLSLPQDTLHWLGWGQTMPIALETKEKLAIDVSVQGSWSVVTHDAVMDLGDTTSRLSLTGLKLVATGSGDKPRSTQVQLSTSLLSRLRNQQLPQLELVVQQHGTAEQSDIYLQLKELAQGLHAVAVIEGKMNIVTGAADYHLGVDLRDLANLSATAMPLLRQFELLKNAVEIDSGSLHLDTSVKSRDYHLATWEQQSIFSLQGVSGSVDEYRFSELALAADWSGVTQWRTRKPVVLSVAKLMVGFEITAIKAQLSLPSATPIISPIVRIDSFSAGLFGGQLFLPGAQPWDFAASSNQLTLRAKDWQLADIVALQKNEDIQAQGILEGELPLEITDGRIIIDNGFLRALPPGGTIRYMANDASRALASRNPELGMVLDLLSDFQYQVLSSEVHLDKAGNLLLGLSLAGSNPARYNGQPINFNINVEQNLDPLLQSLRLSDNLVRRIEGRVK
jgi:hypothetical protein